MHMSFFLLFVKVIYDTSLGTTIKAVRGVLLIEVTKAPDAQAG
jgi:hypothetical protein